MHPKDSAPRNLHTVVFTKTKGPPEAYGDVIRDFEKNLVNAKFIENSVESEMLELISRGESALFVFLISDSPELLDLLNFLPKVKNTLREKRIAILVLSKVKSEKIEDVLKKSGCAEILRYDVSPKGLFFKIRRYVYNLRVLKDSGQKGVETEAILVKGTSALDDYLDANPAQDSNKHRLNEQVVLADALNRTEDYWLFRKTTHVRRYKNQWHVELIGPSPASGKWRLTPDYDSIFPEAESIWAWAMRDPPGRYGPTFDIAPKSWIFLGRKPEYSWEINRWSFMSKEPGLHLMEHGQVVATRFFENEEGMLEMHRNSEAAITRFVEIQKSFDHGHFAELEGLVASGGSPEDVPLPPPPNFPWADKLNSKKIRPEAWASHDLTQDEGPEWGGLDEESEAPGRRQARPESDAESSNAGMEVPLGASAMKDCGIRAMVNGEEVDLVSYSEDEPIVIVGMLGEFAENTEISIEIRSDNLKRDLEFNLNGSVVKVEQSTEGQSLVTVKLSSDSYQRIFLIRDAIQARQQEIFEFFKRAKG